MGVPLDFLLLRFVLGQIAKWAKPRESFYVILKKWFAVACAFLSLSEFILGTRLLNEEDDDVRPYRSSTGVIEPPKEKKFYREFPLMIVPNHDRVEVIPNVKMMTRIRRGQALCGRVGETDEEVVARWRIVYIPGFLNVRIFLLLFLHWVSVVSCFTVLLVSPCIFC